ncbi:hypothetical protein C2E23DRAFT_236022 [Lenzites betulinus]|nr:hypothetical protein C2E23DRAFT_236022 [Lenzites betulinus]
MVVCSILSAQPINPKLAPYEAKQIRQGPVTGIYSENHFCWQHVATAPLAATLNLSHHSNTSTPGAWHARQNSCPAPRASPRRRATRHAHSGARSTSALHIATLLKQVPAARVDDKDGRRQDCLERGSPAAAVRPHPSHISPNAPTPCADLDTPGAPLRAPTPPKRASRKLTPCTPVPPMLNSSFSCERSGSAARPAPTVCCSGLCESCPPTIRNNQSEFLRCRAPRRRGHTALRGPCAMHQDSSFKTICVTPDAGGGAHAIAPATHIILSTRSGPSLG